MDKPDEVSNGREQGCEHLRWFVSDDTTLMCGTCRLTKPRASVPVERLQPGQPNALTDAERYATRTMRELERLDDMKRPLDMTAYPNLEMVLAGCVSGPSTDWPAVRGELRHLLDRLAHAPKMLCPEWTPAATFPPQGKHGCSDMVLCTDGQHIAERFFYFPEKEWRCDGPHGGYLWEVTHWKPRGALPTKDVQSEGRQHG